MKPHQRLFEAEQGNLFRPKQVKPAWKTLPAEVQQEVTKLLAQMLKAHPMRRVPVRNDESEVQHD